jgi:hypothetical protein
MRPGSFTALEVEEVIRLLPEGEVAAAQPAIFYAYTAGWVEFSNPADANGVPKGHGSVGWLPRGIRQLQIERARTPMVLKWGAQLRPGDYLVVADVDGFTPLACPVETTNLDVVDRVRVARVVLARWDNRVPMGIPFGLRVPVVVVPREERP